jgi:hypothetical protein
MTGFQPLDLHHVGGVKSALVNALVAREIAIGEVGGDCH